MPASGSSEQLACFTACAARQPQALHPVQQRVDERPAGAEQHRIVPCKRREGPRPEDPQAVVLLRQAVGREQKRSDTFAPLAPGRCRAERFGTSNLLAGNECQTLRCSQKDDPRHEHRHQRLHEG